MIYYSQIKREFPPSSWKKGQTYYHAGHVQRVKLDEDKITGLVSPPGEETQNVTIWIARGTIRRSTCTCDIGDHEEGKRCEHAAALGIWIVERGSLLRAGVGGAELGLAETDQHQPELLKPPVRADVVAWVRGQFQSKKFLGLGIEAAFRHRTSEGKIELTPFSYLRKTFEQGVWQNSSGERFKPDAAATHTIPLLGTIETPKSVLEGSEALEKIAELTTMEDRSRIVLDKNVEIELDTNPLKLVSLHIGRKQGNERTLSYEFRNNSIRLRSPELAELAAHGRLGNRIVWHGDKLYRFEQPLALLARYANRSGQAVDEDGKKEVVYNGFDTLADAADRPLHPITAYRLMLELGVQNFTVDEDWAEFHVWRKNFEKKRIQNLPDINYGFSLREYQKNGLSWLWSLYHRGLAALLADDMGLGKTHQALALLSSIYSVKRGRPDLPTLVVAPTSVIAAWVQKLRRYKTGLRYVVFHGKSRTLPTENVDVILTTYGILQREVALREKNWHMVLLDEAQAIKNSSTISSRASRVLNCRFRIAMTGTPLENQATDLWSLMEFLLPGYLGSLARFKRLYGSGHEGTSAYQAQALRRLLSPFLLRRTKTQVLRELPEKTEEITFCEMTAVQKKRYQELIESDEAERARYSLESGGKIDYAGILALLTRLKQVCDHPKLPQLTATKKIKGVTLEDSGKWETFSELVREALASDLKIVVFTQYLSMMDLIGSWLDSINVGYTDLRGDTSDRSARLELFANDPNCRVFVCSLLAGGLGIDLTAGSVCIHFDRWWNPARENQATDRLHRIGQTRGVQVFKLQIPGTVEDRIARIIESKKALSGSLIEESPLGLKSFSRKELLELLTLPGS